MWAIAARCHQDESPALSSPVRAIHHRITAQPRRFLTACAVCDVGRPRHCPRARHTTFPPQRRRAPPRMPCCKIAATTHHCRGSAAFTARRQTHARSSQRSMAACNPSRSNRTHAATPSCPDPPVRFPPAVPRPEALGSACAAPANPRPRITAWAQHRQCLPEFRPLYHSRGTRSHAAVARAAHAPAAAAQLRSRLPAHPLRLHQHAAAVQPHGARSGGCKAALFARLPDHQAARRPLHAPWQCCHTISHRSRLARRGLRTSFAPAPLRAIHSLSPGTSRPRCWHLDAPAERSVGDASSRGAHKTSLFNHGCATDAHSRRRHGRQSTEWKPLTVGWTE